MARHRVFSSPVLLVWILGLTQIIGYGTLYYSFAILAADIARDMGWSVAAIFGSFSLSLLAAGLAAPVLGRLIDRKGAPRLMAAGSVAAALALAAVSAAPNAMAFTFFLVLMQVAAVLVLYDAAFVAVVQHAGADAQRRIIQLTLIAGFASTLFWPLTNWLTGLLSWRYVFLAYAAVNLLVCAPLHWLLARNKPGPRPGPAAGSSEGLAAPHFTPLPGPLQPRAGALTTWGFALASFALSAILAQLVPMLESLGFGTSSLAIAAAFGPAQVVVRFANLLFGATRHPIIATLASSGLLLAALVILSGTAPLFAGGLAFAILLGFFSGLKSVVGGTLPLALFGSGGFGLRLGTMARYRQILGALSPFIFAWVSETYSVAWALALLTVAALASLAAFLGVLRLYQAAATARQ
jgi:hypothetical protein